MSYERLQELIEEIKPVNAQQSRAQGSNCYKEKANLLNDFLS